MSKTKVLYHANCDDGFGAAWAIWLAKGDAFDYIPVQYGEEFPSIDTGSDVFIVDFSYPREVLLSQTEKLNLTILDHHKTAMEDLKDLDFAIFDMEQSGAVLTWKYFHPSEDVPKLLQYIQDRDLWKNELKFTEEATAWRRSYPRNFETWNMLNELMHYSRARWVNEGEAILRANKIQIEARVNQASEVHLGEHKVLAVNETQFFSEVAGELAKKDGYPFGACYFIRGDGLKQWSLRSVGDFDVSEVARQFGGGGHKNAAGFTEKI